MGLTTRQKIMGAVMLCAAGAFIWDRATSGGGPAAAAGAATDAPAESLLITKAPAAPKQAAPAAPAAGFASVAAKLVEAASAAGVDPHHADNVFLLPPSWPMAKKSAPAEAAAPPTTRPADVEADRALADEFAQKHHLDAVMVRPDGGYAIVDGKGVTVGRTFDKFKLISVSTKSAVFRRGRVQMELRLPATTGVKREGSVIENDEQ